VKIAHTPGPWEAYDRGIGWEVHVGGRPVNDGFRDTFEEGDARLISAAPDLLAAAKRKLLDCRDSGDCGDAALLPGEYCSNACVALADAIAKAEGRS
jgi:hypothetical protein